MKHSCHGGGAWLLLSDRDKRPPVFINDGGHFHDSSSEHIVCNASFRSGCQNRRTLSTAWLGARHFCSRSPERERHTTQPGRDMPAHGPAQKHSASIAYGTMLACPSAPRR